ncbi:DUF2291 family protein [Mariniflexile sp. HNIBRBA6329]|uniref:DUF2291 family protein n=1 Tax=Mariniflexile sp. HNIBRBA6329 TaxID=3373088 RepID=UPI0037454261
MKKAIKYIIFAAIIGISLYNSFYIKALDEVKQGKSDAVFNAKSFASQFISSKTETLPALNTSDFLNDISKDVKKYSEANGNKLGISNDYYFITEGNATVLSIEEEDVVVSLTENNEQHIRIATDFIFGNAIREGAKIANIGDYQNTMDYNNISVELNNIVRETIIPSFLETVKEGYALYFKGAVKVNIKSPNLKELRVIPLILKLNN